MAAVHDSTLPWRPGNAVQATEDVPPVIFDIICLLNDNGEWLEDLDDLNGGWEGWLQVELALYLSKNDGRTLPR